MKRNTMWAVIVVATVLLLAHVGRELSAQVSTAQTVGSVTVSSMPTTDPCQSVSKAKSSIALEATADAELIAPSGSTVIYVCGWTATVGGTTPSYRFQTGTGTTCGTGTVNETGVMVPSATSPLASHGGEATVFSGAAGAALCIDVGGTTPSVQGVLTYVQQ